MPDKSDSQMFVTRRQALKSTTILGLGGLAGCAGGDGAGGGSDGSSSDGTGGSSGGDGGDGGDMDGDGGGNGGSESVVNSEMEEIEFAFLEGASSGIVTQILKAEEMDKKHDLTINFNKMGLNEAQNALFRGQVETSSVGPIPAARANAKADIDVTIIAPVIRNHHAWLVKPDSDYESLDDMVGEQIATFPRQSSTFNSYAILMNERGYNWEEDFNLTLTSTINILNLFDRGDVAAATHFEPFVTRWVADDKARVLFEVRDLWEESFGRPQQFASVAAQTSIVENEPSKIIKMHRAYVDTLDLIQDDPQNIIEQYSDAYGFENQDQIDLAKERVPPIYLPEWNDEIINSGKADIEASVAAGLLTEDAPTDIFWRPPE